ncbi:MAG: hypothetical protein K0R82_1738 [Flavipsychrobacter sp.]|jgi:thiol-disulfide isomerase/thioredoxin|nr:hypothetical protein [Flavipsychrobacter sp.]
MKKLIGLVALIMVAAALQAQVIPVYKVDNLVNRYANSDTLYIVNFFATWCGPCIKELPEFDHMADAYQNRPVKVLLVSVDFPKDYKKLASFVKKRKLQHEVVWLNESDANYFIPRIDNRWQGSIPATLIVNNKTEYKNFFEGMISAKQLQVLIDKQLSLNN